jgi:formylglycine-generating enzyme required for sulfatase activity
MPEYKEWVAYLDKPMVLLAFILLLFATAFVAMTHQKDSQLSSKGLNLLFVLALVIVGFVVFNPQQPQATQVKQNEHSAASAIAPPVEKPLPNSVEPRQPYEPEMVKIPNTHYEMGRYEVTQGQWQAV